MTYTRVTASNQGTGGGPTDLTVILDELAGGLEAAESALAGKEAAGAAAAAVAAHEAAGDPHPGYASEADVAASLAGKEDAGTAAVVVAAHEAAGDPHPGYATEADVSSALVGKSDTWHSHSYDPAGTAASAVSAHEGAADPHPGYATDGDLSSGLAGKAAASHPHAPSDVTGTAVVTGDSRLSDARTPTAHAASHGSAGADPVTLAQSQVTNLTADLAGKAASSHVHAGTDLTSGTVPFARLPVGSTSTTVAQGDHAHAGGGGVSITTGTGAPTGGTDGDWYKRADFPTNLYRRESGVWVQRVAASGMLDQAAVQGKSYLNLSSQSVVLNAAATAAEAFNVSTTGITKSSTAVTASNANAVGGYTGSNGCGARFQVTTLPGAGQTLSFGVGAHVGGASMAFDVPFIQVNNAGTAILKFFLYTYKTFSGTVGIYSNNTFNIQVMPGAALVSQMNGNELVDFCFLPSNFLVRLFFDTYKVGLGVAGYGVVDIQNVSWSL